MDISQSSAETAACVLWPKPATLWAPEKERKLKLSFEIRMQDQAIVVWCKGRIAYGDEAYALSRTVTELFPQTHQLVLELSQVEMIDGAGLGELAALFQRAQANGCAIRFAGLRARLRDLLELTNLSSVFEIYPTVDEAILSLSGQVA